MRKAAFVAGVGAALIAGGVATSQEISPKRAVLSAATTSAAALNPPQVVMPGPIFPGAKSPPQPPVPGYGALVHLKSDTCGQVASVSVKTAEQGGKGLVLFSDAPSGHWLSHSDDNSVWVSYGRILSGWWYKFDFHTPGVYTYDFASTACPTSKSTNAAGKSVQLYNGLSSILTVKVT